ncbi:MAG: TolC family protein [Flavobacteriales bacterium]|nr:TolC family protein [Flavobacteriales bacterium]
MRTLILCLTLSAAAAASAQGPVSLSLKQAMDMAALQSYQVQAGELSAEKARARVKEVLAIGLPQIEATGGLNNYIDVPTSVIPNFFGGPGAPETLEVQFGIPWTVTGAVQLNQLLFDGSYLVGLAATKELKVQSDQQLEQSRADARVQAAKAYMGVLAAREGARLSADGVPVLEKSLKEAEAMVQAGFMENTDSDRLSIALANAKDRARSFAQQERVALAYLRLVLGVPADTPIELTEPLETIVNDADEKALSNTTIDLNGQVDHQLASTAVRLQTMDVRNQNAAYMPKLYGFFNHQRQSFGTDGPIETDWFPATLWG